MKYTKENLHKYLKDYLIRECPHYLKAEFKSMEYIGDFEFKIFEKIKSKVSVYNVKLGNGKEAFGTIGGIVPNRPYSNVIPKPDISDPKSAAKYHLYWEGVNRYRKVFEKGEFKEQGGLEFLADILDIPQKMRLKK